MTVHEEISGTPAAAPAAWATASQLARALRRREVSSRELLTGYLDRIDRLDRQLGAVVTLDADRAYDEAADADQAIARGEPLGPLHGLPVPVKDSIEVAGMRTTAGAPELGSHVPGRDAVAVARLRAGGAIVFGKTNTPTFAADAQTENTVFGRTSNPWDVSRSPGGSSGGPAAAVAAGLCALDLGSDLGGSIRMPAGYCGVYGLRPSAGLVPVRGHIPPRPGDLLAPDLAVIGPLTRGARDLELVLDAIAGPDDANAVAWRLRLPPPRAGSLGGYRVAVWLDDPSCPVDDEVLEVLDAAVQAIRGPGALVDTSVRPADLRASKRLFQLLVQPQLAHLMTDAQFDDALTAAGGNCEHPHARWARMVTQRVREHTMSAEGAARLAARWAATFRDWDVLLCPYETSRVFLWEAWLAP